VFNQAVSVTEDMSKADNLPVSEPIGFSRSLLKVILEESFLYEK
jgi:hypothetical protein